MRKNDLILILGCRAFNRYTTVLQNEVDDILRATTDGGFEVRIAISKTLQPIIGKSNLTRRLGRVSRLEANRRAASVIVRFQSRIDAARTGRGEEDIAPQPSLKPISQVGPVEPVPVPKRVSFEAIVNGYLLERKPVLSTVKRWRPVFAHFKRWIWHDDAANVMADDVVGWKGELLRSGISGWSVREVYLAALKVVFGWATENRKISINPVTGIAVSVAKAARLRERGFTAIEAKTILLASLAGHHGGIDAHGSYLALSCHRDSMDLHYGRDDFASQERLVNTLSRDRVKDMATDYG